MKKIALAVAEYLAIAVIAYVALFSGVNQEEQTLLYLPLIMLFLSTGSAAVLGSNRQYEKYVYWMAALSTLISVIVLAYVWWQ